MDTLRKETDFLQIDHELKPLSPLSKTITTLKMIENNGSDEFDSRNGGKCYTEESKEVPLEAILNKMGK